jgi:hypothetical protein
LDDKFSAFEGLEAYARSVGEYPKDPERYLSGRLWEDDRDGVADPATVNPTDGFPEYRPEDDPRLTGS